MDEFNKGLKISLHNSKEAYKILAGIYEHLRKWFIEMPRKWFIEMPNVEPLISDFGLGKFRKIGVTEFWIANEIAGGYCGKFLFIFKGQTCPEHMHKEKLETFYIVKGKVRMLYDSQEIEMKPGDTLKIELGKYHSFEGIEPSILLEVSKPSISTDNYFKNKLIPIGGNYEGKD